MKNDPVIRLSWCVCFILLFGGTMWSCSPKTAEACLKRAKWHFNLDKRENLYLKAFELDSNNIEALNIMAWEYANCGDSALLEQSRDRFLRSIKLDSMQHNIWFAIGYTYLTQNRSSYTKTQSVKDFNHRTAISYFSKAIAMDSTVSVYYYQRAHSYYLLSDYPSALSDFTKSCENGNSTACNMVRKDSTGRFVEEVFNQY